MYDHAHLMHGVHFFGEQCELAASSCMVRFHARTDLIMEDGVCQPATMIEFAGMKYMNVVLLTGDVVFSIESFCMFPDE